PSTGAGRVVLGLGERAGGRGGPRGTGWRRQDGARRRVPGRVARRGQPAPARGPLRLEFLPAARRRAVPPGGPSLLRRRRRPGGALGPRRGVAPPAARGPLGRRSPSTDPRRAGARAAS